MSVADNNTFVQSDKVQSSSSKSEADDKAMLSLFDHAETIRLSERDFVLVENLLENPPEPAPALLRAIKAKYGSNSQ